MQRITPFLWFNDQAGEAVKFYRKIFPRSKVLKTARYDEAGARVSGRPAGSVMTIEFELDGQRFIALNGGPQFPFTEAVSFVVNCRTQREVDRYWQKLTAGGKAVQCGWLKDKFGVSWQIVPTILDDLIANPDPEISRRVMEAMLKMVKLDIAKLKAAAAKKGRKGTRA
jgi:predicted 3-demethylubiquinone-9 3-methyltransferase (glyoxalase superfamily)